MYFLKMYTALRTPAIPCENIVATAAPATPHFTTTTRNKSRNSKHGGSGIGLAIVKKIVEDHKGKIWAESVEGEGTTMHLNLLKAKDEENPENA